MREILVDSDLFQTPLIFNVYKPSGPSSFQVVYQFKKNLNYPFDKIGHFGTLDPFAEGLLLLGVQGAQKINDYIHRWMPKTYRAIALFGPLTETLDLTSPIKDHCDIKIEFQTFSKEELEYFIRLHFLGQHFQAPPMFSASKFEGRRLYQLALDGVVVERKKVEREIFDFKIINYSYPSIEFEVTVSSGTYIRTLFEDVAKLLGGFGALKELYRTQIGDLNMNQSIPEELWPDLKKQRHFSIKEHGLKINEVLKLTEFAVEAFSARKYLQGRPVPLHKAHCLIEREKYLKSDQNLAWIFSEGVLLGLCLIKETEIVAVFNLPMAIKHFLN